VFQGSLAVAIIMIDGSEKPNRQLGFELQSSHVIENRNNIFSKLQLRLYFSLTTLNLLVNVVFIYLFACSKQTKLVNF